jgi:hypothetical protein
MKLHVQKMRKEAFDQEVSKFKAHLEALWTRMRIQNNQQEAFFEQLRQVPSLREVSAMCQSEMQKLVAQEALLVELFKVLDSRTDLIAEMKDFECKASDPKRLFAPSFRLLYEEKFRKNAYPNLLKLEKKIMILLDNYKTRNISFFGPINTNITFSRIWTRLLELSRTATQGIPGNDAALYLLLYFIGK